MATNLADSKLGPAAAGVEKKSAQQKPASQVKAAKLAVMKDRLAKAALRKLKSTMHTTDRHLPWSEVELTFTPEEAAALLKDDMIEGENVRGMASAQNSLLARHACLLVCAAFGGIRALPCNRLRWISCSSGW